MAASSRQLRVLVLGGTGEARELARLIAGSPRLDATMSLAGRTSSPAAQGIATRSGGFGGVDGLIAYLLKERIEALVDATHPFAVRISASAVAASRATHIPLATLRRPEWREAPGNRWRIVPDTAAAAEALGAEPRRVFLAVGRLELPAFAKAPNHHYVARLIEPPGEVALPASLDLIRARGPFDEAEERRLLTDHRIDVVVTKNSGGEATHAKIAAARGLGLPVVMIARPAKPAGVPLDRPEEALRWLEALADHRCGSAAERGV